MLVRIASDAHAAPEGDHVVSGFGRARCGWLEAKDVLNARSLQELRPLLAATMGRGEGCGPGVGLNQEDKQMLFVDRNDAAARLAEALATYRGRRPVILAIPRGAVPMGKVIAERLDGELDLVLVRKLHAPGAPEFAVGAIDEAGWAYIAAHAREAGASDAYLREEKREQLLELRRRRARYTPGRPPIDVAGRVAIVIDDGLATGATMMAALHAVRQRSPARLVCAVPVAAPESLELVRPSADEVVCLHAPPAFHAVGQFYRDFAQVEDEEVVRCLRPAATATGS